MLINWARYTVIIRFNCYFLLRQLFLVLKLVLKEINTFVGNHTVLICVKPLLSRALLEARKNTFQPPGPTQIFVYQREISTLSVAQLSLNIGTHSVHELF